MLINTHFDQSDALTSSGHQKGQFFAELHDQLIQFRIIRTRTILRCNFIDFVLLLLQIGQD